MGAEMKSYNRIIAGFILLYVSFLVGINLYLYSMYDNEHERIYQVEINRLKNEILQKGYKRIDISQYSYVTHIEVLKKGQEKPAFFEGNGSDYVVRYIDGNYYRFDYQIHRYKEYQAIRLTVNMITIIMGAIILAVLLYIRIRLLKPFHIIKDVPYELSKGNLTVGLKENKNRFFGRFLWGLDLLREHLQEQKIKELTMQKEKKTLVLALSHDIKTPLSAIKLYSKALLRNLYDSDEKRMELVKKISTSADEIEGFVSDIIKASSEDFLNLEAQNKEYYLEELISKIKSLYFEKLKLLKIDFKVESYHNCLILCDIDRAVEVLQNIIENAVKYGDGKSIHIQFSSEEDCRLITIVNSGCTIPENEIPYIFNSFWRGSNVGSHKGNGLGLYICRQLMKKMDGDIFAECSENEMRVTVVYRMS